MTRAVRSLLFSTLYPSSARPDHGIFVETRLRELLASCPVDCKVVAPVPWFFSTHPRFGEYARMAAIPKRETHNGIEILHPRYLLPPKVGMNIAPFLLALGAIPAIRQLIKEGFDFDLIDAHYVYPDGVAAALIARHFGKPFIVTARGTDINLIPQFSFPRKLIQWTLNRAAGSIGVCKALVDEMAALGAPMEKLHVFRNGVDLQRFTPGAPETSRQKLGWPSGQRTLLSVGYLIERKGHHIAIEALPLLPAYRLVIVGRGPEHAELIKLAHTLGVAERVTFAGQLGQAELVDYYRAADALVLASSREGWANVLLESMACGTPVVATNIWGTPEVVSSAVAGRLMPARQADALANAVQDLMNNYPPREAVRQHAECFSWLATSEAQARLFGQVTGGHLVQG